MSLIDALKFVQGSVAKNDVVGALSHFRIANGCVRGFNGVLALCAPVALDIDCTPKAEPLVKAISNCTDTVSMTMTSAGRLKLTSGKFKVFIDCIEGETPHVEPEGDILEFDGEDVLAALRQIAPFVGSDAARPWTNGVLLKDDCAFATNNVCLIQRWLGTPFPHPVNIPSLAVKELIRVGKAPHHAQLTKTSMTFHYDDGKWIRTQLLPCDWPDLTKILGREPNAIPLPLDECFFDVLDILKPFRDKLQRIYFNSGSICTHASTDEGASHEMQNFPYEGVYSADMLYLLKHALYNNGTVDFTAYPAPCLFFADKLRGAIVGMKDVSI